MMKRLLKTAKRKKDSIGDFQPEAKQRDFKTIAITVVKFIAILFAAYHLVNAATGFLGGFYQRIIHLTFAGILTFLLYPLSQKWGKNNKVIFAVDLLLIVMLFSALAYLYSQYELLRNRAGVPNDLDIVFGTITIILVLEGTRRLIGNPLPILAALFILYALFGNLSIVPSFLRHGGYEWDRILYHLYMTTEGIFGTPLGVSASFIAIFILFGAFLHASGAGKFFIDLALSVFGRFRGGPAQASVVASGFFGSISGSAVANVAGTGTFTIPMMRKTGFQSKTAAAIEAVASSGGQFMPPVMGAAAFIIAQMLGITYLSVAIASVIPAVLFYFSVFIMVYLEARKTGIKGMDPEALSSIKNVLKQGWYLLLPPIILVFFLVVMRTSEVKAALWAIVFTVFVSFFRKQTRIGFRKMLSAMETGAKGLLEIAFATACAGIIIGVFTLTGLGLKLSGILIDLSGGSLVLLLILTMVASIILGMGMPTAPVYIILAVLVAPALVNMGVVPIAAHLFVFYFGIISAITPPVALAAYAGAAIARTDPIQTSFKAFKIGLVAFLLPYMFVYSPELLLEGDGSFIQIVTTTLSTVVGITAFAVGIQGNFFGYKVKPLLRLLYFAGAFTLINAGLMSDLLGILILTVVTVFVWFGKNKIKM